MSEEAEVVAPEVPTVNEPPLTVDQLLPWCDQLTRQGIAAAVANLRAAYMEQRAVAAEQRLAELEAPAGNRAQRRMKK